MAHTIGLQQGNARATPGIMVHLNRAAAIVVGGIAIMALLLYAASRDSDPHGGLMALVIGGYLLPFSAAFALAAVGWQRRWPVRVLLQFLPVAVFYLWKLAV